MSVCEALERPSEKEIYERIWEEDAYRDTSPGEMAAGHFLELAKLKAGAHVVDIGCGTGRGGLSIAFVGGMMANGLVKVTFIDFAANCLDEDVRKALTTQSHALDFIEADLEEKLPVAAPYGFCCDVMEHIPPDKVDKVLDNILQACQYVYFQIATSPDVMGELVGHPLHLTVEPYEWWLKKFEDRDCKIVWSQNITDGEPGHHLGRCGFYVSAWTNAQEIVDAGILNETETAIRENVLHNVQQGWKQVQPYETQDNVEVLILGGGPSLSKYKAEIKRKRAAGAKIVTLNGAYNWCLKNDIKPSATVVVDAREFNARFTHPVVDECCYLVASQVHQKTLEGLPKDRTFLWHTTADMIRDILDEHCKDRWSDIPGGSTVLLRAIPLLRMLGFRKYILYGCDSCLMDGKHHAYRQKENDSPVTIPVTVGNRVFECHPWQTAQAQEFMNLIRFMGDEFEIEIKGDGMLAYILEYAAEQEEASV